MEDLKAWLNECEGFYLALLLSSTMGVTLPYWLELPVQLYTAFEILFYLFFGIGSLIISYTLLTHDSKHRNIEILTTVFNEKHGNVNWYFRNFLSISHAAMMIWGLTASGYEPWNYVVAGCIVVHQICLYHYRRYVRWYNATA